LKSTSSSSDYSYVELLRLGAFQLLGEVYSDAPSSTELLTSLGATMARLPPFGQLSPALYWAEVGRRIGLGAFTFGLGDLFAAAAKANPTNDRLAALGGRGVRPLRVLLLQSSPTDTSRLRLELEHREIRTVALATPDRLDVLVSPATRATDIVPELLRHQPDIVHFTGHGTPKGQLLFERQDGSQHPIDVHTLADVLAVVAPLQGVVLGSCYSGGYAKALEPFAGAVMGSQEALSDTCATAFSRGFYGALAHGKSVPDAYGFGRAELRLAGCPLTQMEFHQGGVPA
jgi:hypothetical protein